MYNTVFLALFSKLVLTALSQYLLLYCCPTQIAAVVNDTNLQLSAVVKGYGEVFNPAHIEPYLQALCISVDSEVFNEGSKKYIKELTQLQSKVSEEMAGRVDVCTHLGLVDVCAHLHLVDVCAHLRPANICTQLRLASVCTHLGTLVIKLTTSYTCINREDLVS